MNEEYNGLSKVESNKGILILLVISLSVNAWFICNYINNNKKQSTNISTNSNEESKEYIINKDNFEIINFLDINTISKNKEIFILFSRDGCYWCSKYAPIVEKIAQEHNFTVYYLDFGDMVDFNINPPALKDEEIYDKFTSWINNNGYGDEIKDGIGTPMTLFVKNGKINNYISGYVDKEELESYIKKEGFIK